MADSFGGAALSGAGSGAATGAMFGPWGAAIGGVLGAGIGAWQFGQAQKGLKNLAGQPMPQYLMSPEQQQYYNTVQQRSQYGFDPNEKAAFQQNVAQQQNTGYQQAVQQSGGNLAQAISAGLGQQKLGAFNQFAGQDAALHRQNIGDWGQAAGQMQQQQNLINQQQIQRRTQLEQAYGGAMHQGLTNIAGGLMSGLTSTGMALDQYGGGGRQSGYGGNTFSGLGGSNNGYSNGQNSLNMNPQQQFNPSLNNNYYGQ